jgi:hypothetical protein
MLEIISKFKYIQIPKNTLVNSIQEAELNKDKNHLTPGYTPGYSSSLSPGVLTMTRSFTSQYSRLLTEEDLNRVKDKFFEDTDFVLEDAIRKHHNVQSTTVPWWIYALLAFFAADNIFSWLSHPLLFYPIIMFGGIISILFSMGLGPVLKPIFRQVTNLLLSRVGVAMRL